MAEPSGDDHRDGAGVARRRALRQTADAVSRTFAPLRTKLPRRRRAARRRHSRIERSVGAVSRNCRNRSKAKNCATPASICRRSPIRSRRPPRSLSGESQALADLVALNRAIAERIANLSESGRTISMLVFNVKIEAASLSDLGEDMRGFVEGLHQLAQRAQQALNQYRLTHGKLYDLLHASSEAQKRFQESHQARLLSIAGEIAASVAAVGDRRRETAERPVGNRRAIAARRRANRSMRGGAAGRRQHVPANRTRAPSAASGRAGAGGRTRRTKCGPRSAGPLDRETRNAAVAGICRLQSRQLGAALGDFTARWTRSRRRCKGCLPTRTSWQRATARCSGRAAEAAIPFSRSSNTGWRRRAPSWKNVARRAPLSTAPPPTVSATMADLDQRTANLSEIIIDVTMIGTNALLKSSRLGDRGKGLSVIAQELRSYAAKIVEGVEELPAALREVAAFVERFAEPRQGAWRRSPERSGRAYARRNRVVQGEWKSDDRRVDAARAGDEPRSGPCWATRPAVWRAIVTTSACRCITPSPTSMRWRPESATPMNGRPAATICSTGCCVAPTRWRANANSMRRFSAKRRPMRPADALTLVGAAYAGDEPIAAVA